MDSDWQGMFVHRLGLLALFQGDQEQEDELGTHLRAGTCGHQSLCVEMEHTLLSKSASAGVVFTPGIIFFKVYKKIGGWHKNLHLT